MMLSNRNYQERYEIVEKGGFISSVIFFVYITKIIR